MNIIPDLTVCLAHNEPGEAMVNLLESLYLHADPVSFEIIVVDNLDDADFTARLEHEFPEVKIFENKGGEPIGKARNHAFRLARGRYISFWDEPLRIQAGCLQTLLRFLDDTPDIGIAAPRIITDSGTPLPSSRRFPTLASSLLQHTALGQLWANTAPLKRHLMTEWDHLLPFACDWLVGSCLIIRREVMEEIGLFDEEFISLYADADYCLRARRSGWHIHYMAAAVIKDQRSQIYGPLHRQAAAHPHALADCTRFLLKKWLAPTIIPA
ncbi:MAG: glycosyltransferase [Desulfobulbaceae bacterium]|nr:glycosyltransferase [Desulfobulbaceae bacterium]HIJ79691.1 glycosyltransferase [Deltaproteobacteria bacterium]